MVFLPAADVGVVGGELGDHLHVAEQLLLNRRVLLLDDPRAFDGVASRPRPLEWITQLIRAGEPQRTSLDEVEVLRQVHVTPQHGLGLERVDQRMGADGHTSVIARLTAATGRW